MQVGDLVRGRLSLGGIKGIVMKVVIDDPINPDYNMYKVHWVSHGRTQTLNVSLLEVISEGR
jgi:hypothetical protein